MTAHPSDAFTEIRSGQPGPHFVAALQATIIAVVGNRLRPSYRTFDGSRTWSDDDITAAVGEFYAYLYSSKKIEVVAAEAVDQGSLERMLFVRCRSWFSDRWRETDVGAVSRKLGDALKTGLSDGSLATYKLPPAVWHRTQDPQNLYDGPDNPIRAAVNRYAFVLQRWDSDTRRDPLANVGQILDMVHLALEAVRLALFRQTLLRVLVRRLGIDDRGTEWIDPPPAAAGAAMDAHVIEVIAAEIAHEVPEETAHTLLADAEDPTAVGRIVEVLGVKRSTAFTRRAAAREAFKALLDELVDGAEMTDVALRTLEILRHLHGWTPTEGSSSESDAGGTER